MEDPFIPSQQADVPLVRPDSLQPACDASVPTQSTPAVDKTEVERKVIQMLQTVYDPEIPVNIYELGLIYSIEVDDEGNVLIQMTLTSPACPVAGSLPGEVEMKVRSVSQVKKAEVQLVWDPPWNMSMMTEAARLQLNLF